MAPDRHGERADGLTAMRVMVTGGGTGGHVYPALSILSALQKRLAERTGEDLRVLYVGSRGGLEENIVRRAGLSRRDVPPIGGFDEAGLSRRDVPPVGRSHEAGLAFRAVPAGAVVGRSPIVVGANLGRTLAGVAASLWHIFAFRPQVVLATGGYVCVPVVLAAWLARVPSLIFLPDMAPGLAIRSLARFATRIAVSFEEAIRYLPAAKTTATGYPARPDLFAVDRIEARRALGLKEGVPVLLVLGGSRGARSINQAIEAALPELLQACQVMHVAGQEDEPRLRQTTAVLAEAQRGRYHLYAYLHEELPNALGAADIVVSRSGASVMGEYPAVGVPSILVPYPYAGAHQRLNAAQLVAKGAAIQVDNTALGEGNLATTVLELLADEERLKSMRRAARELARPGAGLAVADIMWQLARGNKALRSEG